MTRGIFQDVLPALLVGFSCTSAGLLIVGADLNALSSLDADEAMELCVAEFGSLYAAADPSATSEEAVTITYPDGSSVEGVSQTFLVDPAGTTEFDYGVYVLAGGEDDAGARYEHCMLRETDQHEFSQHTNMVDADGMIVGKMYWRGEVLNVSRDERQYSEGGEIEYGSHMIVSIGEEEGVRLSINGAVGHAATDVDLTSLDEETMYWSDDASIIASTTYKAELTAGGQELHFDMPFPATGERKPIYENSAFEGDILGYISVTSTGPYSFEIETACTESGPAADLDACSGSAAEGGEQY
jgi:hypothetical protein